jgi:hypothetical protein
MREPIEFSQEQIIKAIHEYAERRGVVLNAVMLICQGATTQVPDVKQITALGTVESRVKQTP